MCLTNNTEVIYYIYAINFKNLSWDSDTSIQFKYHFMMKRWGKKSHLKGTRTNSKSVWIFFWCSPGSVYLLFTFPLKIFLLSFSLSFFNHRALILSFAKISYFFVYVLVQIYFKYNVFTNGNTMEVLLQYHWQNAHC